MDKFKIQAYLACISPPIAIQVVTVTVTVTVQYLSPSLVSASVHFVLVYHLVMGIESLEIIRLTQPIDHRL